MADTYVANPGTGGNTFASDDIGGVHHPRIKIGVGADGVYGDVSNTNPMPAKIDQTTPGDTNGVQINSLGYPSSTLNNSSAQLAAGATFTGGIETVLSLQAAQVMVTCDTAYTVFVDQFIDLAGTKLVATYQFKRAAGVPTNENVTLPGNYFRLRITNNGAAATTTFRVDTTFGIMNTQPNTLSDLGNLRVVAQENGVVSASNSSATNVAASGVFTGAWEDASEFSTVMVSVFSSHASATDGLSVQFSSDGVNADLLDTYTIPAATGKVFSFGVIAKFYRVVYTNSATLTTSFRLQSLFSRTTKKSSSHRPLDGRPNDNDFEEILAYGAAFNGATWDRLRSALKGVQAANFLATQDAKDSGRAHVSYYSVIPVLTSATDTLQSLTGTKAGATVAATTTPAVVSTGKTFRVTSLTAGYVATATSGYAMARLRFNPAGVVAIGSPVAAALMVGAGTPAAANSTGTVTQLFPEGMEFAAGTGLGVSAQGFAAATATAVGYIIVAFSGYEY